MTLLLDYSAVSLATYGFGFLSILLKFFELTMTEADSDVTLCIGAVDGLLFELYLTL